MPYKNRSDGQTILWSLDNSTICTHRTVLPDTWKTPLEDYTIFLILIWQCLKITLYFFITGPHCYKMHNSTERRDNLMDHIGHIHSTLNHVITAMRLCYVITRIRPHYVITRMRPLEDRRLPQPHSPQSSQSKLDNRADVWASTTTLWMPIIIKNRPTFIFIFSGFSGLAWQSWAFRWLKAGLPKSQWFLVLWRDLCLAWKGPIMTKLGTSIWRQW